MNSCSAAVMWRVHKHSICVMFVEGLLIDKFLFNNSLPFLCMWMVYMQAIYYVSGGFISICYHYVFFFVLFFFFLGGGGEGGS